MHHIFFSSSRPFYQSASLLQLTAINEAEYLPFVKKHFLNYKKHINDETIIKIYQLFEGHTWYMQHIFNELFSATDTDGTCTLEMAERAVKNKLYAYRPLFQSTLNLLPERQKEILYVIAKEGKASQITSGSFNKKH